MVRSKCRAHCGCAILPPQMLRRIVARGTTAQRDAALETLATDQTMRLGRATHELLEARSHRGFLNAPAAVKQRTIYDAHHTETLPGSSVRAEGAPALADAEVNEAYDGLGATFDFFAAVYDRNSIDDEGLHLDATVHYGRRYDNAFWNGQQMVFGDGDGDLFNRFTVSLDVIAHELTHGVTGDEAGLVYLGQAGALNESISDVFGSLVKQYARGETASSADWLIGAGLFTSKVQGVALRSLKAPGTAYDDPVLGRDPQPATMSGYVKTSTDNGGVHTNSGIPNHAFYLAAMKLGGSSWDKAGPIWYQALSLLHPDATFADAAQATIKAAELRHGAGSPEALAVQGAWREVGVA